ncbi:MAG: hypothetical protein L0J63_01160 [Tetragenococcus koreensis]|nr:hypothetical protein [Tetragenococcus koreensis]
MVEVQDVKDRVSMIEGLKEDSKGAQAEEEHLYNDVLEHISAGGKNGQQLVQEALKAQQIKFPRFTTV